MMPWIWRGWAEVETDNTAGIWRIWAEVEKYNSMCWDPEGLDRSGDRKYCWDCCEGVGRSGGRQYCWDWAALSRNGDRHYCWDGGFGQ